MTNLKDLINLTFRGIQYMIMRIERHEPSHFISNI